MYSLGLECDAIKLGLWPVHLRTPGRNLVAKGARFGEEFGLGTWRNFTFGIWPDLTFLLHLFFLY